MSAVFRWPCSISIHLSPGSVTDGVRPVSGVVSLLAGLLVSLFVGHCVRLVSNCLLSVSFLFVIASVLFPFCFLSSPFLSPFLLAIVSVLSPFCFLLFPFLSHFLLMSQKVDLGNASLLSHLFGVYGGVIPTCVPDARLFPCRFCDHGG